MSKEDSKKGQITIFIIIAVVIVAAAVILLLMTETGKEIASPIISIISGGTKADVNQELKSCFEKNEKINEKISLILKQGGSYNPKNFVLHNNAKIEYLCYSADYLQTCYVQKPLLLQSVQEEISRQIKPEIQNCIAQVENSLKSRGYSVSSRGIRKLEVKITPKKINIETDYSIGISKGDDVQSYESVGFDLTGKEIYDLIMIGTSIIQYETVYGDTETISFMALYPNIKIEKTIKDDGTKIYTLTNRNTEEQFTFAVRSLVFPPGYNLRKS